MRRDAERDLLSWSNRRRRKPLVLRGARQVGKSTLVRQFAFSQGLQLNEINLERHLFLDRVFETLDMTVIIKEIEGVVGRRIQESGSLLFLDEIQATPHALQALRYFYEDRPDMMVIAAGSLLEFAIEDHSFSMPVGRIEYHHMGPMTFREFLDEVDPGLVQHLVELSFSDTLPEKVHRRLLDRQREFLFTGGMPEAVLSYAESASLSEVPPVHRSIVDTYQDEFSKYARQKDLVLLQHVFGSIPRLVGKKTKYTNISRDETSTRVKTAIDLLAKARICHRVHHSHCSGLPLQAEVDPFVYKLLFLDVGLVNFVCGGDWSTMASLNAKGLVNEGCLAEQFIGQHLLYRKGGEAAPQLAYWLRQGRRANAEVDYVIAHGQDIVPVEVKAGKSGTLKSLHQFARLRHTRYAVRFDLNQPSFHEVRHAVPTGKNTTERVSFRLLSLPLYAVEELERLLSQ